MSSMGIWSKEIWSTSSEKLEFSGTSSWASARAEEHRRAQPAHDNDRRRQDGDGQRELAAGSDELGVVPGLLPQPPAGEDQRRQRIDHAEQENKCVQIAGLGIERGQLEIIIQRACDDRDQQAEQDALADEALW